MDLATDIAAWVGAAGTMFGIVWAVATWRKTRSHVVVTSKVAYLVFQDGGMSPALLSVTVVNKGQDPVTVTGWGVTTVGGNLICFDGHSHSNRLPTRLESNTSATYYTDAHEYIHEQAKTGWPWKKMRPFANLMTGKTIYSKTGLPQLG